MTDLTYLEQELADLAAQLKRSFKVLDDLSQVQERFETLAQTHQQYKKLLETNHGSQEEITQWQKTLDQRIGALETEIEIQGKNLRNRLDSFQADLSESDRTLKSNLNQYLNAVKQDIEERLAIAAKEWEQHRETLQSPLEEFENRFRSEMKAAVNWVNQSGAKAGQVEMLDTQIRANRSSIQALEKQIRQLQNRLTYMIILIVILALGLPISLLVAQSYTNRINQEPTIPQAQPPTQEPVP